MAKKCIWGIAVVALMLGLTLPSFAQESTVRGGVAGVVLDSTGAVVPGAKIILIGPVGTKTTETDQTGSFDFTTLILGVYSIRVEKQGFRASEVKNIEVSANKHSALRVTLQPGAATEIVEVSAPAITVDTASTAVSANLPDTLYQQIPVGRNVQDLFYIAPGAADSGGAGRANPSISGGSGLENVYVADGVNITDTAFGGLGTFNRDYGSVGTGINLSFVKEVQVKSGGFEPQYGGATGGVVQIITKSGSREYHGALTGFAGPQQLEATRLFSDDSNRTNRVGKRLNEEGYDASAEFGGYVPGMREHVFFFGSINPSWNRAYDLAPTRFGLNNLGSIKERVNTFNYAAKVTFRASDKHTLESSIFGDPAHTGFQPNATPGVSTSGGALAFDNNTGFSRLEYGSRNLVARYNGTLSPTWLLNASFTWMFNRFDQKFNDVYAITDVTQTFLTTQRGAGSIQGYGYYENTRSNNYSYSFDTTKIFRFGGEHSFNVGYKLQKPDFNPFKNRSGAKFPIPAVNASGDPYLPLGSDAAIGQMTNATFQLRVSGAVDSATGIVSPPATICTLCPYMAIPGLTGDGPNGMVRVFLRQNRGEFGPNDIHTEGINHAAYVNDAWIINTHLTLDLGLRWEQQYMKGDTIKYTWTDNWSPRVGVVVDPGGNRNTKLYANFGRYNYAIPLDMAERSLSNELDFIGARWAPAFTTDASGNPIVAFNSAGLIVPVPDSAHLLSGATGGTGGSPFLSFQGTTGIARGTKMEYVNEFVVGGEQRIWGGVILSARYIDRRMPRIVEDASGIPPEAECCLNQIYLITNPSPTLDIFANPIEHTFTPTFDASGNITNVPTVCDPGLAGEVVDTFGNEVPPGAACWESTAKNGAAPGATIADGIPDGFPQPIRNYQAVEIEFNKAFSKNWQMRANWRIAKLFGNFEGAFRNDNGQTDPSISSLFDFTQGLFGLLGGQFTPGYLNTDRRHITNGYVSYVFDKGPVKGLTLGSGVRFETGTPINDLKAHPAYLNAGEVPVCASINPNCTSPRGSLGRERVDGQVDVHADWVHSLTERTHVRLGVDLFNLTNMKHLLLVDQFEDISFGSPNIDFQKPANSLGRTYQRPFYARFMVKFEF